MDASESDQVQLVGQTFELDFGDLAYRNTFESDTRLTFEVVRGGVGDAQTVDLTTVGIRPNVFFQFWQEKDRTTVSRLLDLGTGVVHGNITLPDGTFLTLRGKVTRIG